MIGCCYYSCWWPISFQLVRQLLDEQSTSLLVNKRIQKILNRKTITKIQEDYNYYISYNLGESIICSTSLQLAMWCAYISYMFVDCKASYIWLPRIVSVITGSRWFKTEGTNSRFFKVTSGRVGMVDESESFSVREPGLGFDPLIARWQNIVLKIPTDINVEKKAQMKKSSLINAKIEYD